MQGFLHSRMGHHRGVSDWRRELDDLIARGRRLIGDAAVEVALAEHLESPDDAAAEAPLAPSVAVLGISACASGWVGVLVRPTSQTTLHVGSALVSVVEQVRDQTDLGIIGLHAGSRRAEVDAFLAAHPTVVVVEVAASDANSEALCTQGLTLPAMYSGMGFDGTDLAQAGAAVLHAVQTFS